MQKIVDSRHESPAWPVAVGAPVWSSHHWAGEVYPPGTPKKDWLRWYSRMFNVVEGNSTFYGLPSRDVFQKWAADAAAGFEFCFKVPRAISHDAMLDHCRRETDDFIDRLRILADADVLGPAMLQLGPRFDAQRFASLQRFLDDWPAELPLAVEVRHADFFDRGCEAADADDVKRPGDVKRPSHETRLDQCLTDHGVQRVLFDSRALFSAPPDDEIETVSQSRKPRSPFRDVATAGRPLVRMVGRNKIELVDPVLEQWATIVGRWIDHGLRPIVFTHAPDDRFAPALARRFVDALKLTAPIQPLSAPLPPAAARQPTLFD